MIGFALLRWVIKRLIKNGNVLTGGKFQALDIAVQNEIIVGIGKNLPTEGFEIFDVGGQTVLPALIDIHIHGAVGFDFNTADIEGMRCIVEFCKKQGVGSIFPTILTDSHQTLLKQLGCVAELSKTSPTIKGIHLEGPFLSQKYKGAMPEQFLQPISVQKFEQYQDASNGLIKLVTLAPELEGAEQFVRYLSKNGVVVSLGHSDADFDTAMKCVECGAKSFTHTFNAMKQATQRQPAMTGAALVSNCFCEIIADGKHVHPALIKLLLRAKGVDKVICVTDSLMATGMPNGNYQLGVNDITVIDGDAMIFGTNTRAGSTLTAMQALKNIAAFGELTLLEATKTMTENPAKLLGIFHQVGSIEVGKKAEFAFL